MNAVQPCVSQMASEREGSGSQKSKESNTSDGEATDASEKK